MELICLFMIRVKAGATLYRQPSEVPCSILCRCIAFYVKSATYVSSKSRDSGNDKSSILLPCAIESCDNMTSCQFHESNS